MLKLALLLALLPQAKKKEEVARWMSTDLGPVFSTTMNVKGAVPKAIAIKLPDTVKWRDPTGAAPVNQAILHGDPAKPGLYVVMNRFKPGAFSRPHFHPNDRFIT